MNWRDVYEETDDGGCTVLDVLMHNGKGVAFIYRCKDTGHEYVHHSGNQLIKKQKPKKYRPFTIDEVKCGMVFKDKRSSATAMVTLTGSEFIVLCDHKCTLDTLFIDFTFPDGSPAGMLED